MSATGAKGMPDSCHALCAKDLAGVLQTSTTKRKKGFSDARASSALGS